MSISNIRERFLARVEQVRVRVPLDHDLVEDYDAAIAHRAALVAQHEAAVKQYEENGGKNLTSTPPADLDLDDVNRWIEEADEKINQNSLFVVLQWVPKKYAEVAKRAMSEGLTAIEHRAAMGEAYYLRTEAFEGDVAVDMDLTWADLEDRLLESETEQIGQAALALAQASDAAPFVKRSKTSNVT